MGKKNVYSTYLPFLHALLTKRQTWGGGTPDLFITVKEGEEDTTHYSQRLNVKSALSTDNLYMYLKV